MRGIGSHYQSITRIITLSHLSWEAASEAVEEEWSREYL